MYTVFKDKEAKAYNTNNSKYIQNTGGGDDAGTHKVTGISWEIDDKSYPPNNFKFEFDNTENKTTTYSILYLQYNEICIKRGRLARHLARGSDESIILGTSDEALAPPQSTPALKQ